MLLQALLKTSKAPLQPSLTSISEGVLSLNILAGGKHNMNNEPDMVLFSSKLEKKKKKDFIIDGWWNFTDGICKEILTINCY